jgi:hypothetical protein
MSELPSQHPPVSHEHTVDSLDDLGPYTRVTASEFQDHEMTVDQPEETHDSPEQPTPDAADSVINQIDNMVDKQSEILPDTPQEEQARETIGHNPNLHNAVQKEATLRVKSLNTLDRVQRKARMLQSREAKLNVEVVELEDKLALAKPGSRKHERISSRLDYVRHRRNKVVDAHDRTFGRIRERSAPYGGEIAKVDVVQRTRDKWVIAKQVAEEKKRREAVEEKYQKELKADMGDKDLKLKEKVHKHGFSSERRRELLRQQVESWQTHTMLNFEKKLVEEAEKRYEQTKIVKIAYGGH